MRTLQFILITTIMFSFSYSAAAEIYKWKDASGKIQFSDNPPKYKKVEVVTIDYIIKKKPDIHFSFNGSISDSGPFKLEVENHLKKASYADGKYGKSLLIERDGGWLDVKLNKEIDLSKGFTIELIFKRLENKDQNIIPLQTLVSLNREQGTIAFTWHERRVTGGVWDVNLWSEKGKLIENSWNEAKLNYDARSGKVDMFLNGELIGRGNSPMKSKKLKNILRIGTWHENNQAFTGYIDELKVYALSEK